MTTDPDSDPSDQRTAIRPSPIAGRWYSRSPQALSQEIDAYLEAGAPPPDSFNAGSVVGLVAPHAGYLYSGPTAGHAFAAVKGASFDLVAVLSPLHAHHQSPVLTTAHSAYATPLGTVQVDQAALNALESGLAQRRISLAHIAYDEEHSLEIELPFLQRALAGPFTLLPLMVRSLAPQLLRDLAAALVEAIHDRRILLVGSTDLSHFHSLQTARRYDQEMLRRIESFSPEDVLAAEQEGKGFACGAGAVAVVLWAAQALGADTVKVLHYSTSAEQTGDTSSVVGYGAAALIQSK